MSRSIQGRVLDLCLLLALSSFSVTEAPTVSALAKLPSPQTSIQAALLPERSFRKIDRQAAVAKHGSNADVRALTVSLVNQGGLPAEFANAYGFSERIVNAEMLYRSGGQAAIRESDIVTAVNNLFTALGAPLWAHTNQAEVKKLRVGLMAMYPHLMASEVPPNQRGRYAAVDETMSPVVGTFVALSMIQQKLINPEYKFTEAEKTLPIYTDAEN